MNDNKVKVTECIREFKLRQQYPSVIKIPKNPTKMVILNTPLQSLKPVTTNLTLKTNVQTKNEVRKVKLKLPNGKYLGEFNVQILSNNNDNTFKNKKISVINQNKDKRFYKSITLPNAMLENKKRKLITIRSLQSMKSADQRNLSPNSLYLNEPSNKLKNNDVNTKDDNINYQSKVIASNPVIDSSQCHEESNCTNVENMDIVNESNNCEGSEYSEVQSKLIQSKTNSNDINNILSDLNPRKKFNVIDFKSPNHNLAQQTVNITHTKYIPEHENAIGKNVMVIVHENGMSLLDNSDTPINDKDSNIPIDTAPSNFENFKFHMNSPNTVKFNNKQFNTLKDVDNPSEENYAHENMSTKETFSNHSACKQTINLFQNESPDVKPLETFYNCDNKMDHQISADKSKDTKTVCDTTMKRDDYVLLKPESTPNVQTIASSIADIMPQKPYSSKIQENLNINSLNCMPLHENFNFSPFNQLLETDFENLLNDNLIDNICNMHNTANKVKEVLSQPSISYNQISEQLKKDFKNVRKWDENGMLNIHKAVISNRMYDVQRHLMVLKACNVDVEIPTQSGMTSLELAIKHNASAEIVKLLLEAGANPASCQPIHESAVILASKANSSLLPELIQHVPSNRLLDYFDFSGFAAIHYCAQYGNLEGINSLINKGANINLQESRSGRTALFLAIENNYTVVAQKLIENGAQTEIPNFSGQTVMSLLDKSKSFSLITLVYAKK